MLLVIASFCCILCMGLSTVYHQFMSCSPAHHSTLLQLDMLGIIIMIFGLALTAVYAGFEPYPTENRSTLFVLVCFLVMQLALQRVPCYQESWPIKFAVYCLMIAICFGIALFWFFFLGPADEIEQIGPSLFGAFFCLGLGGVFFRTYFPECVVDNSLVQTWLQSHLLWHVFVVMCGYLNYWAIYKVILIHEAKYGV